MSYLNFLKTKSMEARNIIEFCRIYLKYNNFPVLLPFPRTYFKNQFLQFLVFVIFYFSKNLFISHVKKLIRIIYKFYLVLTISVELNKSKIDFLVRLIIVKFLKKLINFINKFVLWTYHEQLFIFDKISIFFSSKFLFFSFYLTY